MKIDAFQTGAVACVLLLAPSIIGKLDVKAAELWGTRADGTPVMLYDGSHALVFSAERYHYWPRLDSVSTEGQQVAEILEQHGFDVVGVPDPTEDVLRNRVDEFIDDFGFNRDHRLLIYFGGHGFSRENRCYIVPVDAPNPIGGEEATRAFLQKSVNMSEIMSWALRIEAKHVLFVFDSCFSGDLFKSRGAPQVPPSYVVLSVTKPVRQFITVGSQGEEVPAESKFTPLLVSGLRGYADADADSYITGTELGQFLFVNMPKEVGQTPQVGKISDPDLREGEILFRVESPPRELFTKTSNCERQLLELTFQLDDAFKV